MKKQTLVSDRDTFVYLLTVMTADNKVKGLVRTSQKYFSCDEIKKEYIEPRKNPSGCEKYEEMSDIVETGAYRIVELATFKSGVPVKSIEDFCTDQITFNDTYRNGYQSEMFYHSVSLRKNANKMTA